MPAFQIEIRNEAARHSISLKKLEKTTSKMLRSIGCRKAALNILLVSDRKIRSYNQKYLKHDRATDVIAFDYSSFNTRTSSPRKRGSIRLDSRLRGNDMDVIFGDLVVSLETAKRQAKAYGNSFFYEVCFYLCHGILHIMGYDDKTKVQRERMWKKQEEILRKVGVASSR